jgi:hypothetical protein
MKIICELRNREILQEAAEWKVKLGLKGLNFAKISNSE